MLFNASNAPTESCKQKMSNGFDTSYMRCDASDIDIIFVSFRRVLPSRCRSNFSKKAFALMYTAIEATYRPSSFAKISYSKGPKI